MGLSISSQVPFLTTQPPFHASLIRIKHKGERIKEETVSRWGRPAITVHTPLDSGSESRVKNKGKLEIACKKESEIDWFVRISSLAGYASLIR